MVDIADADLPVFPFKVNWKNGISERLEWKTDILPDQIGNEQRRGLRLHPRRDFEVTLTLWDAERSFLDLWLHRMNQHEFLFPLWHDSVRATQTAAQGQNTIFVDTTGLEFKIGSYALLRGLTALSWERVEIANVLADRIVTVDDLNETWPKGTRVEPLVRGRMSDQTRTNLVTSRASETQAEFQTTRAQEYDEGVDSADQYLGLPVVTQQPNRTESLDMQALWNFSESDGGTGRRYRVTEEDRAKVSQKHAWFLRGRTAKAAFRSFLYRLNGPLGTVWLPTFNEDMTLAQDAAVAATSIYIKKIGFAYTGGPSSGREHIMIQTTAGRLYRKVTGTAGAPVGQERLLLDAPLPGGLLRKDIRFISWIDTARLENDRIEFNHVNAADGVSTVASIFKTFRNEREAPAILSLPIPAAVKTNAPCGDGTELCYPIPQIVEPDLFYARLTLKYDLWGGGQPPFYGPALLFNTDYDGVGIFEGDRFHSHMVNDQVGGFCHGTTCTFWGASEPERPEEAPELSTTPFFDGPPTKIEVDLQFVGDAFPCGGGPPGDGCGNFIGAFWRQDGINYEYVCTNVDAVNGYGQIQRRWPAHFTFVLVE